MRDPCLQAASSELRAPSGSTQGVVRPSSLRGLMHNALPKQRLGGSMDSSQDNSIIAADRTNSNQSLDRNSNSPPSGASNNSRRRRSSTTSQSSSLLSETSRNQLNFDLSPDLPPDSGILETNALIDLDTNDSRAELKLDSRPESPEPPDLAELERLERLRDTCGPACESPERARPKSVCDSARSNPSPSSSDISCQQSAGNSKLKVRRLADQSANRKPARYCGSSRSSSSLSGSQHSMKSDKSTHNKSDESNRSTLRGVGKWIR